jgi:hypothetical protein
MTWFERRERAEELSDRMSIAQQQKSELEVSHINFRNRGHKLPIQMETRLLSFFNDTSSSNFTTVVYFDSQENLIAELREQLTSLHKENEILRKRLSSSDSEIVPVAREKVSVTFTPATPGYVNTNVFASPEPGIFDRYPKNQGVPTFTPAVPPPRILFEHESSPLNQVSGTPKPASGTEDADFPATNEQECSSEYPSECSSTSPDSLPQRKIVALSAIPVTAAEIVISSVIAPVM